MQFEVDACIICIHTYVCICLYIYIYKTMGEKEQLMKPCDT